MNSTKYRPYGAYCYFAPVIFITGVVFLVGGFLLKENMQDMIGFGVISTILILYSKHLYDAGNIIVFFELEGIKIIRGRGKYHHILWENILYRYDCRDYKRNLYLLLSQENLDNRHQKKL